MKLIWTIVNELKVVFRSYFKLKYIIVSLIRSDVGLEAKTEIISLKIIHFGHTGTIWQVLLHWLSGVCY